MSSFQFENFVRETGEAIARQGDPRMVVEVVGEGLRRLLGGSFFLGEAFTRPDATAIQRHQLYRDEQFSVVACVFASEQATPIHEHPGWGIVAGISNRLIASTWRRLDDGQAPGFASLSEITRTLVSETSYAWLRPPEETIHRLENPFREPAVTLHVYGSAGAVTHLFDTRAKSVLAVEPPELVGV